MKKSRLSTRDRIIRGMDRTLDAVIFLVCLFFLLIGLYAMYDSYLVYMHANDSSLLKYKPDYGSLLSADDRQLTDDYVAWLTIDDTTIDYPVMQGKDNLEYLNKDPFGDYSLSGSIFLDSRNAPAFTDPYSLVYGHHMERGAMFGAIDAFAERSYFDAHRTGTLQTKDGTKYRITLFAVIEADANNEAIFTPAESADTGRETALAYVSAHALLYETPRDAEQIIGLSTCKYPDTTDRTILFGTMERL